MSKSKRLVAIAAFGVMYFALTNSAWCQQPAQEQNFSASLMSHKFLGAIRVAVLGLSTADTPTKSAKIELDLNAVSFNQFGDANQTLVLYQPKDIKLTKLNIKDDTGQGRMIYDLEIVGEKIAGNVRLVWIPHSNGGLALVRLMQLDAKGNVADMLELRQVK